MKGLAALAASAALLAGAGCGDDAGGDEGGAGATPEVTLVDPSVVADVEARDNRFEPDAIEVAAGTTVRFENTGRNEHNVVAADGTPGAIAVDVDDLAPGATVERRLTEPGTYQYYCSLHGTATAGMTGTITVTG